VRDPLREGLSLPNKRRQAPLQVRGRSLVEAVIDLAGVDEIAADRSAESSDHAERRLHLTGFQFPRLVPEHLQFGIEIPWLAHHRLPKC
jgi:hypothetical protein